MTTQVQPLHTSESKPNSMPKHDKPLPYFKPFIAFQAPFSVQSQKNKATCKIRHIYHKSCKYLFSSSWPHL